MASPVPDSAANKTRRRRGTSISSVAQSVHSISQNVVSVTEAVIGSDLPPGFLAATAQATSRAPSIQKIRSGLERENDIRAQRRSRSDDATSAKVARRWSDLGERTLRGHERHGNTLEAFPVLSEEPTQMSDMRDVGPPDAAIAKKPDSPMPDSTTFSNAHRGGIPTSDYMPPPKPPWTASTVHALKAFWRWLLTPFGFLVTLYGLNIVAWGGMLFLLLCNASPAMCWVPDGMGGWHRNCNDINSPRRKWIEWDSQILNALFCITGLGLAPWRFRDLYYLLSWRFTSERTSGKERKLFGLRKLAGHYRTWVRLPGSDEVDSTVDASDDLRIPLPSSKKPSDPVTGVRSPPTALWRVDFFVWCQVWNTFFQCCLCGFMWGMNRFNRPSWSTGLFVALACGIAGAGGLVSYIEGRRVTRVEGAAPSAAMQATTHAKDEESELGLQPSSTGNESVHVNDKIKAEHPI